MPSKAVRSALAGVATLSLSSSSVADEGCLHDAGIPVTARDGAIACVYLLNIYGPDLAEFQRTDTSEAGLVALIVGDDRRPAHPRARFVQVAPGMIADGRVSKDGVLVVRAYAGGKALPLSALGQVTLRVNNKDALLAPEEPRAKTRVLFLSELLAEARLGDSVRFDLRRDGVDAGTRYSWFRPRTELVIDYDLAAVALAWPSWRFRGHPEVAAVPAMLEVEYRYYAPTGRFYLFPGVGLGPNLKLADAKASDGSSKSGDFPLNGLVGTASIDIRGLQVGFGGRWAWSEGRVDPVFTLSITESVARGLGLADSYPASLTGQP